MFITKNCTLISGMTGQLQQKGQLGDLYIRVNVPCNCKCQ